MSRFRPEPGLIVCPHRKEQCAERPGDLQQAPENSKTLMTLSRFSDRFMGRTVAVPGVQEASKASHCAWYCGNPCRSQGGGLTR